MVKEFLKCNSIRERIQFLADTVLKDWDASELDTVMDIMGLSREGMEAPEDKISAIEKYLADYKHEVEMRGGVDGSKVDSIPAKDQASTLFEGPSEGHHCPGGSCGICFGYPFAGILCRIQERQPSVWSWTAVDCRGWIHYPVW